MNKDNLINYVALITAVLFGTLFISGVIVGMMGEYYFKEKGEIIKKEIKCYDVNHNEIKDISCIEEEIINGEIVQFGLNLVFISFMIPFLVIIVMVVITGRKQ